MKENNKQKRPGRPKKNAIIDRYLLRFRADKPYLKKTLELLAKVETVSLNTLIINILDQFTRDVDFNYFYNIVEENRQLKIKLKKEQSKMELKELKKLFNENKMDMEWEKAVKEIEDNIRKNLQLSFNHHKWQKHKEEL